MLLPGEGNGLFYHICLTVEYPEGKWAKTREFYLRDLSEHSLRDFLLTYHEGLALQFGKDTLNPKPFKSLVIRSTDRSSTETLPPLKAKFDREYAIKKSQEDARNRSRKVVVLNPYSTAGHFYADDALMCQGTSMTSEFIRPFVSTPEDHVRAGTPDPETEELSPAGIVALNQRRRFRYLEYLYKVSAGDSARMFHWREVGATLGMSDDTASMACCYLRQKGLANGEYMTDGISQAGIDEYEQAVTKPNQPTDHFPQNVTITAGHGSNVAVGSHGFSQASIINQQSLDVDLAQLSMELPQLRQTLMTEATEPEHYAAIGEVRAAEIGAAEGDQSKVRQALSKAGTWVLGTATSIGTAVAADAIKKSMGLP